VFHGIAAAAQLIGLAVVIFGTLRVVRAPASAAARAAVAGDRPPAERERFARGLTDFYRISGAIAILVGVLLLLVPVFAA
jgi:uncharacterized membrane protein HdeD (DUF308 family)